MPHSLRALVVTFPFAVFLALPAQDARAQVFSLERAETAIAGSFRGASFTPVPVAGTAPAGSSSRLSPAPGSVGETAIAGPFPALSSAPAPVGEAAQDAGSQLRPRLMVLGGVAGIGGDGIHPYGGLEGGFLYGRFGALALGQYGDGNDFTSLLLAGGPAVQVTDLGFASFTLYGGLGFYQEKKVGTFERDMSVLYGGISVRVPLGRMAAGLTVSLWQGELDGDEIVTPATHRSHRLSIGLGL